MNIYILDLYNLKLVMQCMCQFKNNFKNYTDNIHKEYWYQYIIYFCLFTLTKNIYVKM